MEGASNKYPNGERCCISQHSYSLVEVKDIMNSGGVIYSSFQVASKSGHRRKGDGGRGEGRRGKSTRRAGSLVGPCSPPWAFSCRSLRGRFGSLITVLPPQRHRLLALLLLAAGAYCLIVHRSLHPLPTHMMFSSNGNRSRVLSALRENSNSSAANHIVVVTGGEGGAVLGAGEEEGSPQHSGGADEGGGGGWRWSEVEEELTRRRARVWEVCKANGLVGEEGESVGEPNAWEFFIDDKHHLVWCNIFKAASSSWMYNFNLLGNASVASQPTHDSGRKPSKSSLAPWMKYFKLFAGFKEQYLRRSRKSPLSLARERFPRPSVEQLKAALPRSLSFLIVRDPFERLLSAYRNKIEGFRHKFYRKMAREMISKVRFKTTPAPGTHRSLNNEKSPTFSEFVTWVIESAKKPPGTKEGGYNGIPGFDEHWAPYFRFCTPCAVNFTVIAKMETLSRDEDYIIEKSGIGPALGRTKLGSDGWARPREAVNAAIGGRTEDLLPRYYQTLTREQLDSLYEIYRMDFEMFGYDATKYYNMLPS